MTRLLAGSALLHPADRPSGDQVLRFDGKQTETALRDVTAEVALVVLGGQVNREQFDPMLQALALAASPQHDGMVQAAELLAMSLPPALVVLAPSTWRGDGAFWNPLAWQVGFWHAGASGLVAPLWPVSPEAAKSLGDALAAAPVGGRYEALRAWQEAGAASGRPFADWAGWTFFGLVLE